LFLFLLCSKYTAFWKHNQDFGSDFCREVTVARANCLILHELQDFQEEIKEIFYSQVFTTFAGRKKAPCRK